MAVLRRCRNLYFITLVPSVIFGLIHLSNPDVTFLSILNIILVGILFSYMFIRSGNLWMCMGYHFTWNTFQGVIYGMPVSGLTVPGVVKTEFTASNLLNGGMFGIEGGILTTWRLCWVLSLYGVIIKTAPMTSLQTRIPLLPNLCHLNKTTGYYLKRNLILLVKIVMI